MLTIQPGESITLRKTPGSSAARTARGTLTVTSNHDGHVAYLVRSTAPRSYLMQASNGILEKGETAEVLIVLKPQNVDEGAAKHRFKVQAAEAEEGEPLTREDWADLEEFGYVEETLLSVVLVEDNVAEIVHVENVEEEGLAEVVEVEEATIEAVTVEEEAEYVEVLQWHPPVSRIDATEADVGAGGDMMPAVQAARVSFSAPILSPRASAVPPPPLPPQQRSSSQRLELPIDALLEFITDVEGNWEYFHGLIARSRVLSWCDEDPALLTIADGGYLVFGGDACDKGPGDIRITRALVLLQKQYPERVFLLVGNRDANKLRFAAELKDGELPETDPISYMDAYSWEGVKQQFDPFLEENGLVPSPFSALRWILSKTMGCSGTEETRRSELELLGHDTSDEGVVRSFRELVDPDAAEPWTLQYLRVARVMLVIGDCLFVHGNVSSDSLLRLPAEDCRDGDLTAQPPPLMLPRSTPLEVWVAEMNSWKDRQLRCFESFPYFRTLTNRHGVKERWRGGQPLMMPSLSGCLVITEKTLDHGNCVPVDAGVAAYMVQNRIRRIFTGHTPHGQSPGVVREPSTGVTLLCADTSYSNPEAENSENPLDKRGAAVSVVRITAGTTIVDGVLADGVTPHGYVLRAAAAEWSCEEPAAALVGRRLVDGSWGKTVVDGQLQTQHGEGFKLNLATRDVTSARRDLDFSWALPLW
eukprot:TRINITY_DN11567_c0_g1_i1.p1 TRINITY_DN11567_c0_g1~~TRINITY_DN11567_c0_g1_i1.p1  ORF type:complete len:702 (-),score=136.39 TRINITY_DN11567_c0_g1_i1:123-2228(-)